MSARCDEIGFSLEGEEGDEMVEGVTTFRYLVITIYQTYDCWLAVRSNIMRAKLLYERPGKLLLWEGADPRVAEMFYMSVIQAMLLYGSET